MSGRPTREAGLAVAYALRTGCAPAEAARKYGLAASTVRLALARAGVPPRPVGRPKKSGG
jgi:ketol-acid reductoisomerase